MNLSLNRSKKSGTLFLHCDGRALGIVFQRETEDGYGWKAGPLGDNTPYPTEESALDALYAALNFSF